MYVGLLIDFRVLGIWDGGLWGSGFISACPASSCSKVKSVKARGFGAGAFLIGSASGAWFRV